ncbi:MAG TPA: DUF4339 domain-containing protein [Chthoniobacteraceae bacterium]|nr:DUF4339 domain-containing protein [Chthoniobacteraceae bacterium]
MDIQILHDGDETGPYTEEAVQALLKDGSVRIDDLAWRPGMDDWIPLVKLLYPAASAAAPARPAAPVDEDAARAGAREPATKRQKAFLSYLGIAFPPEITREDASLLVNDAMENPKDPARVARWNDERLRLYPELFAAEIQARKENRAQRYFEICQEEGAACFDKVTRAHCQVLVGHLDVRFPNWDANEREAPWKYFFPALAEKFPQLVTEEGKEKLKQLEGARAPEPAAHSSPVVARTRSSSPVKKILALVRGAIIGLVILAALWFGRGYLERNARRANEASGPSSPPPVSVNDAGTKGTEGTAAAAAATDGSAAPAATAQ